MAVKAVEVVSKAGLCSRLYVRIYWDILYICTWLVWQERGRGKDGSPEAVVRVQGASHFTRPFIEVDKCRRYLKDSYFVA